MIGLTRRRLRIGLGLLLVLGEASSVQPRIAAGDALRRIVAEDSRVANVAFRLKTANLDLCSRHGYDLGLGVHALDAYAQPLRNDATALFGLRLEPGISVVVPDGPAFRAGLRVGDSLVSADGIAFATVDPASPTDGTYRTTQAALDLLDRAATAGRVTLIVSREGKRIEARIDAAPACAGRVQLKPSHGLNAWSDDRYATITTAIARYAARDDDLALIMGHELAHLFLHHEALLDDSARRRGGLLGRSPSLVLQTERDADYLGLYLATRAGFDVAGAADFWRRFEKDHGASSLLFKTHPGGRERVRDAEATVAEIAGQRVAGREPVPQRAVVAGAQ